MPSISMGLPRGRDGGSHVKVLLMQADSGDGAGSKPSQPLVALDVVDKCG